MPKVMCVMSCDFVANFILFPVMQKFWKSIKVWQSYTEFTGRNFLRHSVVSSRLLLKHWAHLAMRLTPSFRILDGASQLSLPSLARSSSWCRNWGAWHYRVVMLPVRSGDCRIISGTRWIFLFIGISCFDILIADVCIDCD